MIRVLPDLEAASRAAADELAGHAAEALEARGRFTLALAGGRTPRRLYEILATDYVESLPWSHTDLFWGDERCVRPADPRSNYHLARTTLLERVPIRDAAVHRIPAELGSEDAAAAYDAELARFFGRPHPPATGDPGSLAFDVVLLGLGVDGHTASLFPGDADREDERWARPARAPAGVEPAERVTLTLRALNASRHALFLVAGAEKRDALARVRADGDPRAPALDHPRDARTPPAALVRGVRATRWYVDEAAAGR